MEKEIVDALQHITDCIGPYAGICILTTIGIYLVYLIVIHTLTK